MRLQSTFTFTYTYAYTYTYTYTTTYAYITTYLYSHKLSSIHTLLNPTPSNRVIIYKLTRKCP